MEPVTIEIDGVTYIVSRNGKPVYKNKDGKELEMDVPGMSQKIVDLGTEARTHREAKAAAEDALAKFEGIEDPAAAIKALNTVKNLDDKKLVDAGEIERVKTEAIKAVEDKYKPVVDERDKLQKEIRQEKIGGAFARSKFISEKLAVPMAMVERTFGEHFSLEDGKILAKDSRGNQIYSAENPGEPAGFDEAIEILVNQSPFKDDILKGTGSGGGGGGTGKGGNPGGKTVTRAEMDRLGKENPAEASRLMSEGYQVVAH